MDLSFLDPKTAAVVSVALLLLQLLAGRFPALAGLLALFKKPAAAAPAADPGVPGGLPLDRLRLIRDRVAAEIAKREAARVAAQAADAEQHDAADKLLSALDGK